jgi:hypothetical protein
MKARLFCHHCGKHYEVAIEEIRAVQAIERERFTFAHNTYFYTGGCFFKTAAQYKRTLQK